MAPTRSIRITLTERETEALIYAISNYQVTFGEGDYELRRDLVEDFKAHDRILAKINRERRKG